MRKRLPIVSGFLLSIAVATPAVGENAIYEIPTAGVVCGGTAAQAEAAVRRAGAVESVKADPGTHVVVARFDDETTSLDAILASLRESGMETGEPKRID
jgi:copper chaperone CopZ